MADLEFMCIGQSVLLSANSESGRTWIEENVSYRNETGGKTVISHCHLEEAKTAAIESGLTVGVIEPA